MVVLPCGAMSTPHARQYSAISERLWANAALTEHHDGCREIGERPSAAGDVADGHRPLDGREALGAHVDPGSVDARERSSGFLVEVRGFEPLASAVRGQRSTGLSYTPRKWSA